MLIIDYRGNSTKVTKSNAQGQTVLERSNSSSSLLERCTLYRKNSSTRLLTQKAQSDRDLRLLDQNSSISDIASQNIAFNNASSTSLLHQDSTHHSYRSLNASFNDLNSRLQAQNEHGGNIGHHYLSFGGYDEYEEHGEHKDEHDNEDPLALMEGLKQAIERQARRKTRYTKEATSVLQLARNRYSAGRVPSAVSAMRRYYKLQTDLCKVTSLRKQLSDNLKELQAHVQRGGGNVAMSMTNESNQSPLQLQLLTVEVVKSMTDDELLQELELIMASDDGEEHAENLQGEGDGEKEESTGNNT